MNTELKVRRSPGSAESSSIFRRLLGPWATGWRMIERTLYAGHEYVIQVPSGKRVYAPWFESGGPFAEIMTETVASGTLIVSADRCYVLHSLLKWALADGGPIAECGVFNGGTARLLAATIARSEQEASLHLFDTFSGMPNSAEPTRDHNAPGDFGQTSLSLVRERLARYSTFTVLHPGFMPDTFAEIADIDGWAFVHMDVDIYPSMLECCRWFWPRMKSGGIIVFDDYGFFPYRNAARAAIDQYFLAQSRQPLSLPTGQAMIIKP